MPTRTIAVAALLVLALAGCSGPTPEERLRATLRHAESSVEAGALDEVRELIADDYLDGAGRDKATVMQLLALQRAGAGSVYLLVAIRSLEIGPADGARVLLLVAVAGTPVDGLEQLSAIDADLLRVELVWRDDPGQGWRLISAAWRRAEPGGLDG